MKNTRSWLIIIGITIASGTAAIMITRFFGWWNFALIACIIMLIYAFITER